MSLSKSVKNRQRMEKELHNMDPTKKGKKAKKDPLDKLEDAPDKKCGDVKVWCETAVTNRGVLEGKVQVLDSKASQRVNWTQRSLEQQVKLFTKICQRMKLETAKGKEQCQKALKDLKTSNAFMTQNNQILEK